MKKLIIVPLLALLASCTISEQCDGCKEPIVQTIVDTLYIETPPVIDTLYVEVPVVEIDTVYVDNTIVDTLLCKQVSKTFDFKDFPKGCTDVTLDGIVIDSDAQYSVVDTYAGLGLYVKDGISFDFSSYGEGTELDYIYYKAVDCPGEYIYWDNGQMELPHRSYGQPVYLNIDQITEGFYLDIKKKLILLEFGIKTYECDE